MATIPRWEKFPVKAQVDADALKAELQECVGRPAAQRVRRLEQSRPIKNDADRAVEKKELAIMIEDARKYATACVAMLEAGKLPDALAYCAQQRVDPPQCSLTAESPNARRLRMKAMEHLSDEAWWRKRLTIIGQRDAEMDRMKQQRQG
jgi:hypothetical protein